MLTNTKIALKRVFQKQRTHRIENEEKNLHRSLRFVFVIAQIFGFFPLGGVLTNEIGELKFSWLILWWCISSSVGGYFITLGHFIHMAGNKYDQFEMSGVIFYSCGATSCILFIKMAKDWPEIMAKWRKIDEMMKSYGWPKTLDKRLKILSITFLMLEAVEHVSIQANKLIVAVDCRGSFSKGLDHFFLNMSFPHVFNLISYSKFRGSLLQIINTRMAFSWTFLDLFIILISCALAMRFQQINAKVRDMKSAEVRNEQSWENVREDYVNLCKHCRYINDKMSWMIVISFGNNMYFITIQIFGTIHLEETVLERVYFFISLGLLVLRLALICLYASWIHDESKIPMYILASTPHNIYNREIERFIEGIRYEPVAFTGKQLFTITRHSILTIAGVIVTYELILIQFHKEDLKDNVPTKNSIC